MCLGLLLELVACAPPNGQGVDLMFAKSAGTAQQDPRISTHAQRKSDNGKAAKARQHLQLSRISAFCM
eukprot:6175653-Pleurochrysis_carterae.AAC.2